jgi:phenylacetate-coenzyme A ligase PaaK-like adenylate-forming protein
VLRTVWDTLRAEHGCEPTIARLQRERLHRLVRHARTASPYYRSLYQGLPARVSDPSVLPPVVKQDLMAHFDDWVTDPDLTLAALRRDFLSDLSLMGSPYLGRYHVFTTSGTTGEPATSAESSSPRACADAARCSPDGCAFCRCFGQWRSSSRS